MRKSDIFVDFGPKNHGVFLLFQFIRLSLCISFMTLLCLYGSFLRRMSGPKDAMLGA